MINLSFFKPQVTVTYPFGQGVFDCCSFGLQKGHRNNSNTCCYSVEKTIKVYASKILTYHRSKNVETKISVTSFTCKTKMAISMGTGDSSPAQDDGIYR